jgi:hypothetical protein
MGFAKAVTAPPLLIFAGAVLMFSGWIACESVQGPAKTRGAAQQSPQGGVGGEPTGGPPPEALLGVVQVGTPRPLIERELSVLPAPEVDPIDTTSGTAVLRVRYRFPLARFVPHLMPGSHPHTFKPGKYVLALDFDGGKPGHPLLRGELVPGE